MPRRDRGCSAFGLHRKVDAKLRVAGWVKELGLPLTLNHNDLHENNVFDVQGRLRFFDFGDEAEGEEPLYRIGQHIFAVGEYVSITDEDGRLLTYKVTEVTSVTAAS